MNKYLGYILTGTGTLGLFFFLMYEGKSIPLKELWFVLSLFTMVTGSYFLAKYKLRKLNGDPSLPGNDRLAIIEELKRSGEKVKLTPENVEVKNRSYQEEIINEGLPSRVQMLDALYDDNRNHKTRNIQQTYIVFYKKYNGKDYRFVSQATTMDVNAVERFIRDQGVELYIDPNNPTNYFFEFPFK